MFHKSGYGYGKNVETLVNTNLLIGPSILYSPSTVVYQLLSVKLTSLTDGSVHSRHRKVMNPAFSAPQLRSFLPLFRRSADKVSI